MKSCLSGRPWHVWPPASLPAERLGSPVSQTAVCPSTEVLRTGSLSVQKPFQPQSNQLLGSRTLATCPKMTFRLYSLWVCAGWHLIILNPKAFRLPVLLYVQAAWLPYCSTGWETSGLEIVGFCSQDRPYDGLWAREVLAPAEFLSLWLFSATHSTKTDQNYVRLHQSAQCSLQHSSFPIYCASCGFGFCQKWGIILPSSFLQPQRKH